MNDTTMSRGKRAALVVGALALVGLAAVVAAALWWPARGAHTPRQAPQQVTQVNGPVTGPCAPATGCAVHGHD